MIESGIINKNGKIHFKTLTKAPGLKKIDMSCHENLKNELKFLYTAITRTRLRLIIFDDKPAKRQAFEKILKPFDIIENLNSDNFESLVFFFFLIFYLLFYYKI